MERGKAPHSFGRKVEANGVDLLILETAVRTGVFGAGPPVEYR